MSTRVGVSETEKTKAITEMKNLIRSTNDPRLLLRYQAILMILLGKDIDEIGSIIGKSQATVYNYASAYGANGISGLFYKTSTYSPKRMTKEEEDLLVKTIAGCWF